MDSTEVDVRLLYGKCHRKHTAPCLVRRCPQRQKPPVETPAVQCGVRVKRCGLLQQP